MRINFKMLPKKQLLHHFDLASKTKNKILATQVVSELAKRNHISIEDQIRKLGQKAINENNLASFQMVIELWKVRD